MTTDPHAHTQKRDGIDAAACDALHDGIAQYSADARLVFWNAAFAHYARPAQLEAGLSFEAVLRAVGPVRVLQGHAPDVETFVRNRLANHRRPNAPVERRSVDGRNYILREQPLPDGGWIETVMDVTEWRQHTDELATMVDLAPVELAHFDTQDRLQTWNRAFGEAFSEVGGQLPTAGQSQAQLVRERAQADGLSPRDVEDEVARQARRHRNLETYVFERNGRKLEVTKTRAPGGGTLMCARDVTLLRTAEAAAEGKARELEQSHAMLQSIVNSLPVDVAHFDRDDRLALWNKSYEARFTRATGRALRQGEPQSTIVRERFKALGLDGTEFARTVQKRVDEHRALGTREFSAYGQDVIVRQSRVPDGGTLTTIIDVTPQKNAERNLQTLFEHAPTGMLMVDPSGTIIVANRAAEQLLGYAPEALVGLAVDKLVPHSAREQHASLRATFHRAPAAGSMASGRELQALRKDGHLVPIEVSLSPVTLGSGAGVIASLNDISSRHEARAAQETKTALLEKSNQALQQFAFVSSHDLQEPLRVVSSFAGLLKRRYENELDDKARRYIEHIVDGAGRMSRLIQDLLEYSRVGETDKAPEAFPLGELVEELSLDFRRLLHETRGSITADPLPTLVSERIVVQQILRNLVGNALKYRGEAPPCVHISADAEPDRWHLRVSDNGIGIEPEYVEQIFDVFKRLHTRTEYDGTGIGLAICRRAVEHLGGVIWAEASEGQGATFHFTLPREAP